MIDQLESRFREAGLIFPFDRVAIKETDSLPEPASYQGNSEGGTLFYVSGAPQDSKFTAACSSIAMAVYRDLGDDRRNQWDQALFYPTPTIAKSVQNALQLSASFEQAVETLNSPVTRLVAIHCFNALLRSGTSFESAKTINLSEWGGTADLITGKSPCSLLPLLGAYSPLRLYTYFPDAVTSLVVNNLDQVTSTEVRGKFAEVIRAVVNG